MIDVSDGLLQDLGHLCEASHVGALIDAPALPLSPAYHEIVGKQEWSLALTGGEDYELLFSAPTVCRAAVAELAQQYDCAITCIGRIVPHPEGIRVNGPDGALYLPSRTGHDHFR